MNAAVIQETCAGSAAAVCAETGQLAQREQGWELLLWLVQRARE